MNDDRSQVRIVGGTFAVVASGYADGPSQPLVRFLNERGARSVVSIAHPLSPETAGEHVVQRFRDGVQTSRSVRRLPNRPPLTYAFDPIAQPLVGRVDGWFGFNCLATAEGLVRRRLGRVRHVVHWNVDFVPDRFGSSPLTKAYEWLDRRCCTHADGRVELSEAALDGRRRAYRLPPPGATTQIVPMGAWTDECPTTSAAQLDRPRAVFLGHLVERMGVDTFIEAMAGLARVHPELRADVVGGGPLLTHVRAHVSRRGLDDVVTVHGFVERFADVQRILAGAVIAVAPYAPDDTSFSRFADPGKLKAYLGASLPILLTDVPPNAQELATLGGAEIVASDAAAFAAAIATLLADPAEWARRHEDAHRHARRFDWDTMLQRSLPALGVLL